MEPLHKPPRRKVMAPAWTRRILLDTASAVLLGGCAQGSGGLKDSAGSFGGLCPALLDYAGREYAAHGDLVRDPATTGRVQTGIAPGCDDGDGAGPGREVRVAELADLPRSRAVLVEGSLYVRTDRPFPDEARIWFVPRRCEADGSFELAGVWLSVKGPKRVRFDGDLRVPYQLEVRVTDGPADYVGTTVHVHANANASTQPVLGPRDVKTSLWKGGKVQATIRCDGGAFQAVSLTSAPG